MGFHVKKMVVGVMCRKLPFHPVIARLSIGPNHQRKPEVVMVERLWSVSRTPMPVCEMPFATHYGGYASRSG